MNSEKISILGKSLFAPFGKPVKGARSEDFDNIIGIVRQGQSSIYEAWHKGQLYEFSSLGELVVRLPWNRSNFVFVVWMGIQYFDIFSPPDFFPYQRGGGSIDFEGNAFGVNVRVIDLFRFYGEPKSIGARELVSMFHEIETNFKGLSLVRYLTPGGFAAALFRERMPEQIRMSFGNGFRSRLLAMRCYWGGRSEAFVRGKFSEAHSYDIPSAYPSACTGYEFPLSMELASGSDWLRNEGFGFFRFTGSDCVPCLPEVGERMIYPVDGFTHCTFGEIRVAASYGVKVRMIEGYKTVESTDCLSDFMWDMLEERDRAKGDFKQMWKLAANSLIGKFAQNCKIFDLRKFSKFCRKYDFPASLILSMDELGLEKIGIPSKINCGPVFMPEWAAMVTGQVRADVSNLLNSVENPMLVSTDCVVAGSEFSGSELVQGVEILRARLYRHDGKETRHGLPGSPPEIWNVWNAKGLFEYNLKSKTCLNFFCGVGEKNVKVRARAVWDNLRILDEDGQTKPWQTIHEFHKFVNRERIINVRLKESKAVGGGRKRPAGRLG